MGASTLGPDPVLRAACAVATLAARWHRGVLVGVEHLPAGAALLVGNHGLFGWESFAFFWLLYRATGRMPRGLTDRVILGNPVMRPLLSRVGGEVGTRGTALDLLARGELVVCYPGGSREVFKAPDESYRLLWDHSAGFAEVAIRARVPVVPFGGLGVDDCYVNLGHVPAARRVFGRYAIPVAFGLGPLPLPVKLRFVLGRPIVPPDDPALAPRLKASVEREVLRLLRHANSVPARSAALVP